MIIKKTNKDDDFYAYMGKFFGSRIVQTETKDRIYDDNNKVWYIYLNSNDKPCAFISICNNVIKNVYTSNNEYLEELLLYVKHEISIASSTVTRIYEDIYLKCGFTINSLDSYKHFIMIRGED